MLFRSITLPARASHWDTLMSVRPYVVGNQLGEEMLYTTEITLPATMALPPVGRVVPHRGPFIPSSGEIGLLRSPYGPQPSRDRCFFTPSVYLPEEYGGYL